MRGYVARNQVQVRVDALAKLGEIIDAAVSAGATNVSSIRFDLKDRDTAEREALRLAVRGRARARRRGCRGRAVQNRSRDADRGAARLGLPPRQPVPMYAARSEAVNLAVPIESGEIEVRAHVTLTAAIK